MTYPYRSILIVFFLLVLFSVCCQGQTLRFENLTIKDGLPSSECYKILQDKAGYIWVFSEFGIAKHDGIKFIPVCTNLDSKDQNAYAVFQSNEGDIYFSNSYAKVFRVRNDSAFSIQGIEAFTQTFSSSADIIFQIVADTNQDIYFSTFQGSYCYRSGTEKVELIPPASASYDSPLQYLPINGSYFSIRYPGAYTKEDYQVHVWDKNPVFIGSIYLESYYETRKLEKWNDFFFLAVGNRIYKMNDQGFNYSIEIEGILTFKVIKNQIWVLTRKGLKILTPELELVASCLEDKIISDLCIDRNEGLWLTTIGDGVYYCRDQNLLSYSNTNILNEEIHFIKHDSASSFLSNTADECYSIKEGQPNSIHKFTSNVHCGSITSYKNGLLFGTKKGVFFKDVNGKNVEIPGNKEMSVYSNLLWIINDNEFISFGGTHVMRFKNFAFQKNVEIPDKFLCTTPFGSHGFLIGTVRGIHLYDLESDTVTSFLPFFSNKSVMKLIYDTSGNLWISTKGEGVYIYTSNKRLIQYSDTQPITINDIDFFGHDGVLFATNHGVYTNRAKMQNKTADWICFFEDETNCVEIVDSTIWIASKSGLYSKKIDNLYADKPSPMLIHSVYTSSTKLPADFVQLKHYENDLRFNFNFLNYKAPAKKFYYTLIGPTKSAGTINGNVLQIQNLSPGSYTLNVFPFNGFTYRKDLFLSKTFEITPAFWQTYWFRILAVLTVVVLSGSLVRYYYRSKRKRERAIAKTNSRIAEYKLTALRAQINPHFVSNSMAAIQLMIDSGNADRANLYIAKFGLLIRYVLKYSDKSITRLSDELKIIDLNIELEQLRFSNNFLFLKQVDENVDLSEIYVPPLITQPFIENAIWHGLIPLKSERQPTLILKVFREDDFIVISIIDNGLGRAEAAMRKPNGVNEHKESKGTQIIRDRIYSINQLYTTTTAEVTTIDLYDDEMNPTGTQVTLRLPATLHNKLDEEHYESNSYR